MCLGLVVRSIHEGACAWIPSPPQRVIGPVAYYPLEGGGVMKEPPPSLIVAGLMALIIRMPSIGELIQAVCHAGCKPILTSKEKSSVLLTTSRGTTLTSFWNNVTNSTSSTSVRNLLPK